MKGHPFYLPYTGSGWGTMVDLGGLGSYYSGYTWGYAYAINSTAQSSQVQIVGMEYNGTRNIANEYAFLSGTTTNSMVPLQTLVPGFASSNFGSGRLSVADDIDSTGHIAGVGITNSGTYDAFLMMPALPGDANLDGKVDINDLTVVLGNYSQSVGMSWTTGDFNGDGRVDINDLTIVLEITARRPARRPGAGFPPCPNRAHWRCWPPAWPPWGHTPAGEKVSAQFLATGV